jgi:hypothetical protein
MSKTPFFSTKITTPFIQTLFIIVVVVFVGTLRVIQIYKITNELETYLLTYVHNKYGTNTTKYVEICDPACVTTPDTDTFIEPTLRGTYEYVPDEYVWEWSTEREGYYILNRYIDIPEYYLPEYVVKTERSWYLKNADLLEVECEEVDLRNVKLGDIFKCSVSYNGKVLSSNVRYNPFCFGSGLQSCSERIGIVVYSNRYGLSDAEYLIIGSSEGLNHNKIEVYRLEKGEAQLLPFKYEYKDENFSDKSYMISAFDFDMYGIEKYGLFDLLVEGDIELVTFFQEPTMGVNNNIRGLYNIWKVEDDGLYLKKSVMELIDDWGGSDSL